ncbi:MAG: metallopeptidase [Candidatus Aenigmarchaeota archaeon]|nr:metallopeptidase [Candidatus Aenigmarchaeota archaeon]
MKFEAASDIQEKVTHILDVLSGSSFLHIRASNLICMRSYDSKARAYARIWSLPRIWQAGLGVEPHYIIEVLSQFFDKQSDEDQIRTLIHELMHIPKTFSGALVPHKCFNKKIDRKTVELIFKEYKRNI